ncbi:hypothetical protein ATZ36_00160 [Candidatus Endomicrobiellum trichonymphae]|uniref:Tail specific protease domain-containing protein n=1 Tax=Endomicrobium trichonymphae TaxID=1408204 RepID=A0A1E5IKV3_ENDTX|nr:hypothetical protein ATZ36_00160 [Candidatus Endomicrobium trichonymphae]
METTLFDDDIAYIRLIEFGTQIAGDIKKRLAGYKKQGIRALILDLRNNHSGLLGSAVNIISMFIKDKILIITAVKGRVEEMKKEYFTTGDGEFF